MNDIISIFKKDLLNIVDNLRHKKIIKEFNNNSLSIDYLSKSKKGDLSTNLYIILSKKIIDKKFSLENYLTESIHNLEYIKNIHFNKGFININFDKNYLISKIQDIFLNKNNYGNNNSGNNKKINLEFVSANPTGPIHLAHMRGAVFGDVLASMLESIGYTVTREYYVNDTGSQIEILGNSLFVRYQQLLGINISLSLNEYPGDYLKDMAQIIVNSDNDKWIKSSVPDRKIYFEKFATNYLIDNIKKDLSLININFEKFTYESNIISNKFIDKIFKLLKDKNLLYEGVLEKPKGEDDFNLSPRKQLLFRSTNFSDDKDRPFKKSNGDWTYFANDAAYHYEKYTRGFVKLINIWGSDHIGYISRMKSISEVISEKENYLEVQICQIVRLIKNGNLVKMSKRDGNFITLKYIFDEVGKDPLRYFMVSSKNETPMDFDIDKVIEKNKDNPVFYCQYAYARASSVINKSKKYKSLSNVNLQNSITNFNISYISSYEWEIILKILTWPYLLNQSAYLKQPHKITNYLEDICSNFHSFWNKGKDDSSLRFIDESNFEKTITKLIWIESFRIVLKRAFKIIGIDFFENM